MRQLSTILVLVVISAGALLVTGCASGTSNDKPYALTGDSHRSYATEVDANRATARGQNWNQGGARP